MIVPGSGCIWEPVLFALSDSLIAINKFVQPIPYEGVLIMGSYYLAQYMIVNGVIKGEREADKTNPQQSRGFRHNHTVSF